MFNFKRKTKGEIFFDVTNNIIMLFVIVVMVYPFLNQLAISFSSNSAIMAGKVSLFPKGINLEAYKTLVMDNRFFLSMKNSVIYTLLCTGIQMAAIIVFAYPLSKKYLKGRKIIMGLLVFSMMFGTGGLVPNYLLIKKLGLINNYLGLILPGTVSIWNIIVLKNFYQQIPETLEESALIDGASNVIIFMRIILPLSIPAIAAITLFVAVGAWNTFFSAIIYLPNPNLKLLQVYLNDILQATIQPETANSYMISAENMKEAVNSDSLKAAALLCATVPILIVYPFLQKYFITGLMVGSIKG